MIDTTRTSSLQVRGSQAVKEEKSSGDLLHVAVLNDLSAKISLALESSPDESEFVEMTEISSSEDTAEFVEDETTKSMRQAIEEMIIAVESTKVSVAESQSSRSDSSLKIDEKIRQDSIAEYEKMQRKLEKMKKKMKWLKGFSKIMGDQGSVQNYFMQSMMAGMAFLICGPVVGGIVLTIAVANASGGTQLMNEGFQEAYICMGGSKEDAKIFGSAMEVAVITAATAGASAASSGAAAANAAATAANSATTAATTATTAATTAATAATTTATTAATTAGTTAASTATTTANTAAKTTGTTLMTVQTALSQTASSGLPTHIIERSIQGDDPDSLELKAILSAVCSGILMLGSLATMYYAPSAISNTAKTAEATTNMGKMAQYAQTAMAWGLALGSLGEAIGSFGQGTMKVAIGKNMEDQAEIMSRLSLLTNMQSASESDVSEMTEHIHNLLGVNFDYSAFSQPGQALARALR